MLLEWRGAIEFTKLNRKGDLGIGECGYKWDDDFEAMTKGKFVLTKGKKKKGEANLS